ncbi:hypothetical protein ES703_116965 [subsurface metagenome]
MKIEKIKKNSDIYAKIKELADFLDIGETKIITNSVIFGFYKYWILYKKNLRKLDNKELYSMEVTDELQESTDSLKTLIESDFEKLQHLSQFEEKLEKKYLNSPFPSSEEYRRELLDIIEKFSIEEEKEEEPKETLKKPEEKQIGPKEKILKPIKQKRLAFSPNLLYTLHKHGLYIFSAVMISSLLLISVWVSFPYFQMLSKLEATLTILSIVLFLSLIIGIFYYRSFPTLEKWQITRIIREFHKNNPDRIFKNPTERTIVLAGYIQTKYASYAPEEQKKARYWKIPEDPKMREKPKKFIRDIILYVSVIVVITPLLLSFWIPLLQMQYLERWEWIVDHSWIYLITWGFLPFDIIAIVLLYQHLRYKSN